MPRVATKRDPILGDATRAICRRRRRHLSRRPAPRARPYTRLDVGQFDEDVGVAGFGQLAGTRQILTLQLARIEFLLPNEIPVEDEGASLPAARIHRGG